MDRYKTLGERIRHARLTAGLSQSQLAAAVRVQTGAKVSKSLISQWERGGVNNPKNANLLAVQSATGFSMEWLVRGRGPERISVPSQRNASSATIDRARLARALIAAAPTLPTSVAQTIGDLYDIIGDTPEVSDSLLARIATTLTSRV